MRFIEFATRSAYIPAAQSQAMKIAWSIIRIQRTKRRSMPACAASAGR
jgi:hypothetical protein